jgi:hypothetical protein
MGIVPVSSSLILEYDSFTGCGIVPLLGAVFVNPDFSNKSALYAALITSSRRLISSS